jgi:HlyD family secretion protein
MNALTAWSRRLPSARLPRDPRARRGVAALAVLAACGLVSLTLMATGPDPVPDETPEKAWPVSTAVVQPATLRPTFLAFGRVESSGQATLRSDLTAEIVEVTVREGDWAQAGQLLVRLDDRDFALRVREAEADLAQARATHASLRTELSLLEESRADYEAVHRVAREDLKRHEALFRDRLIAQGQLDGVRAAASRAAIAYRDFRERDAKLPNRIAVAAAGVARAQAQLEQARLDLARTRITAPFSGPVVSVAAARGERAGPASPLLELADAARFEVRIPVPEAHLRALRRGAASGQVSARTPDGLRLPLSRLASRVRPGQSGTDAFFSLGPDTLPALGRLLDLTVVLPEEAAVVALPVQSLFDNRRVYAVDAGDRLRAIDVERVGEHSGPDGAYRVLVRAQALRSGDRVITTPLPAAISGLLVAPIEVEATAGSDGGAGPAGASVSAGPRHAGAAPA